MKSKLLRLLEMEKRKCKPKEQSYQGKQVSNSIIERRSQMLAERSKQHTNSKGDLKSESVDRVVFKERKRFVLVEGREIKEYIELRLDKDDHVYIFRFQRGYGEVELINNLLFQAAGYYRYQDEDGRECMYRFLDEDTIPNFDYFDAAVIAYKVVRARTQLEDKVDDVSKKVAEAAVGIIKCAIIMEEEISKRLQNPRGAA